MVIGLLVLIAIGIIVLARVVAAHTQETDVVEQRDFATRVASRIEPLSQEALVGQDNTALGPRIAKGKTVLYDHALHGFSGQAGTMPAKGNRLDIPDALIEEGVDHMISLAKH